MHVAHNTTKPGLVLENLSAGYQKKIIVDDISLAIPQQKITVLVGANGCGKSTLLSTIARLLQPLGGAAVLDGKAIHAQPTKAVARQLGILPQSPLLPEGLTVFELVSRGRFPWQNVMRQWSDEDEQAVEEAPAPDRHGRVCPHARRKPVRRPASALLDRHGAGAANALYPAG